MAELTPQELALILSRLDHLVQEAKELSTEIRTSMAGARQDQHAASDWTDRRAQPERRRKLRG